MKQKLTQMSEGDRQLYHVCEEGLAAAAEHLWRTGAPTRERRPKRADADWDSDFCRGAVQAGEHEGVPYPQELLQGLPKHCSEEPYPRQTLSPSQ